MRDVVIVGGGPAGLAAGLWLARYRRSVTIVDAGAHRNRWTEQVHGYLGWDPVSPHELVERAHAQVRSYDEVEIASDTVQTIEHDDDGFHATTSDETIDARRVILATGVSDQFPDVENFFTHYGAGAFHCPACDGYEARGKDIVVLGWGEHVPGFVRGLFTWARSVALVTDGPDLEIGRAQMDRLASEGVKVLSGEAVQLVGERGDLRGVKLRSGDVVECQMAFFSIAHHPRNSLARELGCDLDDEGYVVTDKHGRTSVDGVFAAGDCSPGYHLVQVAAAQGAAAGIGCARSLMKDS